MSHPFFSFFTYSPQHFAVAKENLMHARSVVFFASLLSLVTLSETNAQTASIWNKATNNQSWMEPTNWTPSGVPNGPNVEASLTHNFTGTSTAGTNIALNGNVELGTLIGGDSTPSSPGPPPVYQNVTVVPGTPTTSTLTFNVSTGSAMINSNPNGGGRLNFSNVPVVLMDPLLITWGGNASNLNFQAGSVVSTGVGAGVTGITIQGSDAGVNGDLSLSPVFFGAANTYNGDLTINGGRVALQNEGGVPATTSVFVNNVPATESTPAVYSRFDLDLAANGTYTINGLHGDGFVNATRGDVAHTLAVGSNNGDGNFSGIMRIQPPTDLAPGGRKFHFEKTGTGTQVLSGANTYNGTTTVSGGTLLVNGSHKTVVGGDANAIPGAYTVEIGATLGGSGIIEPAVNVIGSISPGTASPGTTVETLTVGGLTLQDGAFGVFELNPTDNTAGSGVNDMIRINGALVGLDATTINLSITDYVNDGDLGIAGTWTLAQYDSLDGSTGIPNFNVTGIAPGFSYTVTPTSEEGPGSLLLTLTAVTDTLFGDFNNDGIVNLADYTVWRDKPGWRE